MKRQGGYLLVENRFGPAPSALVLPNGREVIGGTGTFESSTYTCSHCSAVVVMNPERKRERARCWNCDHVLCDQCGALAKTQACVPMAKRLEEGQTRAIRDLARGRA